ncbi:MAG: hypothetical protein WCG87_13415, partial [Bacteroidota bacterium]
LGGYGNNDLGCNYAGIFGCNVIASMGCAFHINNLVAQSIPPGNFATCAPPASLVGITGALYYIIPTGTFQKVVFVV